MTVKKRPIVLVLVFMCLAKFGWCQTYYSVAELKNHVGETVRVRDSVYSGEMFQKTVMVMNLGDPKKSQQLTLIMYGGYEGGSPRQYLHTYQAGKISFTGLILMSPSGPIVVLKDRSSVRFEALGKI